MLTFDLCNINSIIIYACNLEIQSRIDPPFDVAIWTHITMYYASPAFQCHIPVSIFICLYLRAGEWRGERRAQVLGRSMTFVHPLQAPC